MTEAIKDNNRINTVIGTANDDGSTPTLLYANPSTHSLCDSDGTTGSDLSGDNASRDNNRVPVLMAVSSADGKTPVAIYINPASGELLTKST